MGRVRSDSPPLGRSIYPLIESRASMAFVQVLEREGYIQTKGMVEEVVPLRFAETRRLVMENQKNQEEAGSGRSRSRARKTGLAILIGTAGAVLYAIRPREPQFHVAGMKLKGFNLRFGGGKALGIPMAVLDVEIGISIRVSNPNITPVEYKASLLRIFYHGSLLGSAQVSAGSQAAHSSERIELVAKMDGVEVKNHVKELAEDVVRREMQLTSLLTMDCSAWLWKWGRKFQIDVESHILVDPLFLDVVHQENIVHLQL